MSGERAPRHIEARMLQAMRDLVGLASDHGLEDVFAFELFQLKQRVQDATRSKSRGDVDGAAAAIRDLAMQLARAAGKRTGASLRTPSLPGRSAPALRGW